MELEEKLTKLGFTKVESKVYLTMLKLGSSKAGEISKEAQLNRTTTYGALKNLIDKGLVSFVVQANRKWFKPADPNRILEILKEREEEANKILPNLLMRYKEPKEKHDITLYYGKKGIKTVFQDFVREKKPIVILDYEGKFVEKMPYFAHHYIRQVEKNKIKIRHIVKKGVDISPSKTTEVRFIPENLGSQAVMNAYGDKVSIIVWSEVPEAVVIKNKHVADAFKNYFEILWKVAKP